MSESYVIEIDTTVPVGEALADEWVERLASWHGVVSAAPDQRMRITITLPAEGMSAAIATALAIAVPLAGEAVAVVAMPERVRDAREGWAPIPELMAAVDAAAELGVSRQRVLQMVDEGKLPAVRVGRAWALSRAAVEAARERAGQP